MAAEKTAAAVQPVTAEASGARPGLGKSPSDAGKGEGSGGNKAAGAPVLAHDKRRALGRGLESLLPGPRPLGGGGNTVPGAAAGSTLVGTSPGSGPAAGASAATGQSAATVPHISEGAAAGIGHAPGAGTGQVSGMAVPGTISDLQAAARRKPDGHEVIELAIERIDANPHQTRSFTQGEIDSLDELSDSIKVQGVLQPITVRPGVEGRYFLITGERRMRASQMAGKTTVPAIVRVVSEQQAAEMTVIENLQRRDLTCIDLARAYIMLSKNFNLTQEQIGERVGAARETISNYMRLAKLPQGVQYHLQCRELEFSHARVLLNLDPEVVGVVAHKAVTENMSVDDLERYVLSNPGMLGPHIKKEPKPGGARWVDPNVRAAQRDLERILGVRVKIRDRHGKGKITLEYATLEDFDRVIEMLKGKN